MATLFVVKTADDRYFLQGTDDPSRHADFSLYDWDGEGGDPFAFGALTWEIVDLPGLEEGVAYDADDPDSFWQAQAQLVAAAQAAGIAVPPYATE